MRLRGVGVDAVAGVESRMDKSRDNRIAKWWGILISWVQAIRGAGTFCVWRQRGDVNMRSALSIAFICWMEEFDRVWSFASMLDGA